MKPHFTRKKGGKQYRYYTCMKATKSGHDACPIKNVPAGVVEKAVLRQVQEVIHTPQMVARVWKTINEGEETFSELQVVEALQGLDPVWDALFPGEQNRLLQLLVAKVVVQQEEIEVHLRSDGLTTLVRELSEQRGEAA